MKWSNEWNRSITEAMRASGVKRFICCLAAMQKREGGESFMLRMFSGYVIKTVLDDMARMESYLFENCQDLDFTILRPTGKLSINLVLQNRGQSLKQKRDHLVFVGTLYEMFRSPSHLDT